MTEEALLGIVGTVVEEVEVDLGMAGIGLAPVGFTVACILAREEAVGACNLEVETEVGLGRVVGSEDSGGGGGGAARTFFRISA
jgi:hypothetical protein